jgi:septum formation protein
LTDARHAELILASSSPQRRSILERLGVAFTVVAPRVPELERGKAREIARENALRKARWVGRSTGVNPSGGGEAAAGRRGAHGGMTVLGADTVVSLAGELFAKPRGEAHARAMLAALSGRTHTVLGGIALLGAGGERAAVAATEVRFRDLDEGLLDWYLATGEWRGRAGGYAIQGAGTALVREVRGDYENVVGLPVATLLDLWPDLLDR